MAAAGNYKIPPPFDEKTSYETWKNEIEIWRLVTDLDKKKQALAVTLSLAGRARESALEIPAGDLNADTGMATLLTKLDSVFLKEEKDRQYEAYTEFDRITRESGVSMVDYIVEFERRYNRLQKFKMELPDAVLAFKLLDTAGLNIKDKQLALTACSSVSFANMKSALKRIFGDAASPREGNSAQQMNNDNECAYFTRYTGNQPCQPKGEPGNRIKDTSWSLFHSSPCSDPWEARCATFTSLPSVCSNLRFPLVLQVLGPSVFVSGYLCFCLTHQVCDTARVSGCRPVPLSLVVELRL
ncbi:hypothetical protein WMY93_015809 [Mugilogobius chulae]|uniref:Retrotransposon gag domain-containing protein n=1 Tax=Mugilogobius chulae TaxID=88201 RepID=A0AAW0NS68_9GOBI